MSNPCFVVCVAPTRLVAPEREEKREALSACAHALYPMILPSLPYLTQRDSAHVFRRVGACFGVMIPSIRMRKTTLSQPVMSQVPT